MPRVHVCSLARIDEIASASGARSMVTLINVGTPVERPACIAPERHLFIGMSDIAHPVQGLVAPDVAHVETLLSFVRAWDRREPLLIHCWAGVSRSTAAAFVTACALNERRAEDEIAATIRAASPTATPNPRFVAIADERLGLEAAEDVGRDVDGALDVVDVVLGGAVDEGAAVDATVVAGRAESVVEPPPVSSPPEHALASTPSASTVLNPVRT